ncbi:MAG TPA: hypothetical protein VMP42_07380 [Actinomycetota bacterium]|nr:hypothetical protein [Actinomycetota bacterium]
MVGSNALVDAELLEACRNGDPGAFQELVERTQHRRRIGPPTRT